MLIRSQLKQLTSRGGTRSAEDLLDLVGLDAGRTLAAYPHELSGGQRQRVLIAMALTRDPSLVIADEPTTALDVTVQKQVVDLLGELREELGFAMVFVSHDLALVAQMAHHITVMYAGQVVEQASTHDLLIDPGTSTPAVCWVRCCPSRRARSVCTRCRAPCPPRAISPAATVSHRAPSTPRPTRLRDRAWCGSTAATTASPPPGPCPLRSRPSREASDEPATDQRPGDRADGRPRRPQAAHRRAAAARHHPGGRRRQRLGAARRGARRRR